MPSAAGPLVLARNLRKTFSSFTAVDGIDFEVRPGEAFGFLDDTARNTAAAVNEDQKRGLGWSVWLNQ